MGKEKTTQVTSVQSTPEEKELNKILLDRTKTLDAQQTGVQSQGLDLVSKLLAGEKLPGYMEGLPGGISEDVTTGLVNKSIEQIRPSLQKGGIYDSGMRAELEVGTAADIRLASEEYNQNLLLNLLNLAVGGQAQIQAPIQSQSSQLASSLAGLRSMVGQTTSTNPFIKSFQESAGRSWGQSITGGRSFSYGPVSVGGTN
jgi:hypothetical protein